MGMRVLRELNEVETLNQRPVTDCKVTKCGQLTPAEFAAIVCKKNDIGKEEQNQQEGRVSSRQTTSY